MYVACAIGSLDTFLSVLGRAAPASVCLRQLDLSGATYRRLFLGYSLTFIVCAACMRTDNSVPPGAVVQLLQLACCEKRIPLVTSLDVSSAFSGSVDFGGVADIGCVTM